LLFALLAAPGAVFASVPLEGALNALRARPAACAGGPVGAASPLVARASLDAVAAAIAASPGVALDDALLRSGYHARRTVLWQISGVAGPAALAAYAEQNFCRDLHAPELLDIGVFRNPAGTWIVLAQPLRLPAPGENAAVGRRLLTLVNQARAQPRLCGDRRYASAAPLVWNDRLAAASLEHAADMAHFQYLDHTGRDGSSPGERARRAGYAWRAVGENIASGQPTPMEVTASWIASPGHCANLMNPAFTAMGAAYALNPEGQAAIYWAQVFAAPQ
jgi:uncharacterized protein YkwD